MYARCRSAWRGRRRWCRRCEELDCFDLTILEGSQVPICESHNGCDLRRKGWHEGDRRSTGDGGTGGSRPGHEKVRAFESLQARVSIHRRSTRMLAFATHSGRLPKRQKSPVSSRRRPSALRYAAERTAIINRPLRFGQAVTWSLAAAQIQAPAALHLRHVSPQAGQAASIHTPPARFRSVTSPTRSRACLSP